MRFYYTTSAGEDTVQQKNILSLGGYKSATRVPNDDFSNLFGSITSFTIDKNQPEYIALMLVNETGSDVTGLNIYFTFPEDSYSKYEVGAVEPSKDSDNYDIIERIDNIYSRPFDPDFFEADGVDNAVSLGDLENGSKLGIWIKRTILKDVILADWNINRLEKSGDIYIENELNTEDSIQISLSWD